MSGRPEKSSIFFLRLGSPFGGFSLSRWGPLGTFETRARAGYVARQYVYFRVKHY